jgi:hypothetical protein
MILIEGIELSGCRSMSPVWIPRLKVSIDRNGRVRLPSHALDTSSEWWTAVFNDPKADPPRPNYGGEYLGSMAGMLFGVRCEKCGLSKNFFADDLIKMYGGDVSAQTVAAELSDCNRRSQGCLIRYVARPRTQRE